MRENRTVRKKKKIEYSKLICGLISFAFFLLSIWIMWRYYQLVEAAISSDSSVSPDVSLPVAGISFIIAPLISYLTYQWGLKNSRNKYGVDEDGQPYNKRE